MMAPFSKLALATLCLVTTSTLAFVPHKDALRVSGQVISPSSRIGSRKQPQYFRPSAASKTHRVASTCLPSKSSTSLSLSSSNESESSLSSSISFSAPFGIAWLCLVGWAFSSLAPGSLGSAQDTDMINAIIANPVSPGINELYYTFFNFFATIPVILASLVLPQGRQQGLPAAPFLALSAFFGYFAAGPYLTLRAPPIDSIDEKLEPSWITVKFLENKAFSWFILLFTLYLPVAANVFGAYQSDPAALWQGFVDLVSTSRFAAVSLVDILILYASSVALTPRDYRLRRPEASESQAFAVAAATALVPIIGSAFYCAVRPKLPEA